MPKANTNKSQSKTKTKKTKKTPLFGLYGARLSESKKYVNLSVVSGEVNEDTGEDNRQWATVIVKKKSQYVKVKVNADSVVLTIPRLDIEDEEDEDEDEDEDEEDDALSDSGLVPIEEYPF